jgi:hypothetical protein
MDTVLSDLSEIHVRQYGRPFAFILINAPPTGSSVSMYLKLKIFGLRNPLDRPMVRFQLIRADFCKTLKSFNIQQWTARSDTPQQIGKWRVSGEHSIVREEAGSAGLASISSPKSVGCPTLGVAQRAMRDTVPHARGVSKARQL